MKCPRTTTGKHEFRKIPILIDQYNTETFKKCVACGVIDNTKDENK